MTGSTSNSIEQLVVDGRLRPQPADAHMLGQMVEAARDDLRAADAIEDESASWAEAILYEAGLRCARVIVQAAGWRISADRGHQTAIDAADSLTEGRHHKRLVRLHRMRRMLSRVHVRGWSPAVAGGHRPGAT